MSFIYKKRVIPMNYPETCRLSTPTIGVEKSVIIFADNVKVPHGWPEACLNSSTTTYRRGKEADFPVAICETNPSFLDMEF
mmetsp:Transcript_13315/g.32677  ORF Transcript_13315/g.32677 Transcript_13315/m.32677 type:complete len:81 (-) Transcript_13315:245-487(-)